MNDIVIKKLGKNKSSLCSLKWNFLWTLLWVLCRRLWIGFVRVKARVCMCVCEGQEIKDPFLCSVRSNNSVGNLWCFYSCAPIHHDSWYRFSTRDTCRNDAPTRYNSAENHMYQTYTRCTRLDRSNRTMNWMSTRATDQPRLKCFCKLEWYQNEFWIIPYPDLNNSLSVTSYWSKLTFLLS